MTHHNQIDHKLQPRENQKVAIDDAVDNLRSYGFHGLLLEMSLGKTKCALNIAEILNKYGSCFRIQIIAPKAIQSVWLDEIPLQSHITEAPVIWENKKTISFQKQVRDLLGQDFPVLLTRLELFQKKNPILQQYLQEYYSRPTICILDESSKIKNVTTQRTPRLIEYTNGAAYNLILTGTPWTESPLDIFAQMEFLKSGFWYTASNPKLVGKPSTLRKHWYIFRSRYAIMREIRTGEGRTFKTVVGTRRTEEIANKIRPYVTQQKKEDWLDLPEKMFQTLHVEMNKEQKRVYQELKENLLAEYGDQLLTVPNAVTLLTRLRQVAGGFFPETGEQIGSEVPGISTMLEDLSEYSGKIIIAASYVAEIQGIYASLVKQYSPAALATYYGDTKDREAELHRFKEDLDCKFLILNPQSGAYGLNLQHASLMYLYSRPYSYEQNAQLLDRIHRPGQRNVCIYKDVVHTGTVQEKVIQAIKRKKDVVDKFDNLTFRDFLS